MAITNTSDEIKEIIDAYNVLIKNIENKATSSEDGRAYGGIIRAGKGKLTESIAKLLVQISWKRLNQDPNRLKIIGRQIKIPINKEYITKIELPVIKNYITTNLENYKYKYKPDVLVAIDDKIVLEIECKTYTENAMFKRILVDATLLTTQFPNLKFVLLQLESQLTGDYSELNDITYGSKSTHTLLSYFNIDLHIITLLQGERNIKKPIHKPEFFKPLTKKSLENAIQEISEILKGCI